MTYVLSDPDVPDEATTIPTLEQHMTWWVAFFGDTEQERRVATEAWHACWATDEEYRAYWEGQNDA